MKVTRTVSIEVNDWEDARKKARNSGTSVSGAIRLLIRAWLDDKMRITPAGIEVDKND